MGITHVARETEMPEHLAPKLISWASILEENTRNQAMDASRMPFIYPHIALMPDAHLGKGATVGSVIPTQGAIIPAAVGVDIGCGMIAHRTNIYSEYLPDDRTKLRKAIENAIPLSAGKYNRDYYNLQTTWRLGGLENNADAAGFIPDDFAPNWRLQLGSLGSGNHFIEVTVDEEDRVWLFLHSGSRGVGNKIAMHHIKVAQKWCERAFVQLPDPDLAYLIEGTEEFEDYIAMMQWAQGFAFANRAEMMMRLEDCFSAWIGGTYETTERINCHHNYTEQEDHFGRRVWLTRKGAIDAHEGVWGLIPGSMGTASYVVQGKGNPVALHSSPHGAGRNFSRSAARKQFTIEDLRLAMKGIEYRDTDAFIDEIPAAYKDVEIVMADAADLVEVKYTLRQLVNVKGT